MEKIKKIICCICAIICVSCNTCLAQQSYRDFIKNFPRKKTTIVKDYAGNVIKTHSLGVLDVRVTDVQQCADAAIRLRAEYFYTRKEYDKITFRLTCGLEVPFSKWAAGARIAVKGNNASLTRATQKADYSRENFERYLHAVMTYAGSASLYRDLHKSNSLPEIGDLLIRPGYPGHVVIVIDRKTINGTNYYLFANSWIPAQDIEIVEGFNKWGPNNGIYTPIRSMDDSLYINGYYFKPKSHLRKWQTNTN